MRTPKYKTLLFLAVSALLGLPGSVSAQKIKILGISGGGTTGTMKAELADLPEGRKIKSVVTRRYQMSTSQDFPKENSYKLYGDKYIVADLDFVEGTDHFYRMEVTLDDDSRLKTDMYNAGYTEGAVWADEIASDFTWFSTPRPWTAFNHTPITTEDPDGRPLQIHPGFTYKHGMSMRATADGSQNATLDVAKRNEHGVNFTSVRFTFGLQAYAVNGGKSAGNGRVIFKVNGAETGWKGNMKSASNGGNPYFFDAVQAANPISTIGLQSNHAGVDNIAVLGAVRLYYPVPANSKTAQTIVFETPGGKILPGDPDIDLSAYSTGDTQIFFTMLQGSEIAELKDGHILHPLPDKSGEVVIEAFTFGNDAYAPASATQSWSFKFGPTVEYLDMSTNENGDKVIYIYADTDRKDLTTLRVKLYDGHQNQNIIRTIDLVESGLQNYATHVQNVYAVPAGSLAADVPLYSIDYQFAGDPLVTGRIMEGREGVYYLQASDLTLGKGSFANASYNGSGGIRLGTRGAYRTAVSLPVGSAMETKPAMIELSLFSRFAADVSGHKNAQNLIEGNLSFLLYNGTSQAYLNTGNIAFDVVRSWNFPLQSTETGKTLKVVCNGGFFGVGAVGSPRLYYKDDSGKADQEILLDQERYISNFEPFTEPLPAVSSAGLPLFYRVVWGSEYASIQYENIEGAMTPLLSVNKIPNDKEGAVRIVVEAYSPGDKYTYPAATVQSNYELTSTLVIPKEKVYTIKGGSTVGDMVIYGDANSCGQAVVTDGIASVEKLTLKYTFVPNEWTYISFPSDLDLAAISDLEEIGENGEKRYRFSTTDGENGTYMLLEYDSEVRANEPDADPWRPLPAPHVKALRGYMMKIQSEKTDPVEISFVMNNLALDFHNKLQAVDLSLDLSQCEPESRHTVYVRPVNVKGNTLQVDVRYVPTGGAMKINHSRALEDMRVTYSEDRNYIRLTLPDQTPAKVVFYDIKGKKIKKAVNYVSPQKIDVTGLKGDSYRMVVIYGPATTQRIVDL